MDILGWFRRWQRRRAIRRFMAGASGYVDPATPLRLVRGARLDGPARGGPRLSGLPVRRDDDWLVGG